MSIQSLSSYCFSCTPRSRHALVYSFTVQYLTVSYLVPPRPIGVRADQGTRRERSLLINIGQSVRPGLSATHICPVAPFHHT